MSELHSIQLYLSRMFQKYFEFSRNLLGSKLSCVYESVEKKNYLKGYTPKREEIPDKPLKGQRRLNF